MAGKSAQSFHAIPTRFLAAIALLSCVQAATWPPRTESTPSQGAAGVLSTFDRGPWLDDYANLRAQLESSYANLTWFASPEGGLDLPEIAAAVFQDNRMARLVGLRTKGLGCGFMYKGSEYTLPHAGLRYRIPNCIRLRADGSNEVGGIVPDVEVPTYEGESEPDRAVRFLEAIGRDLHLGHE